MAEKVVDAFTSALKKVDTSELVTSAKKVDTSIFLKKMELPSYKKLGTSSVDIASLAKKTDLIDGIKKLETDSFTKKFGDTVKNSNFYKKDQNKLLGLGITVAGAAGWYGTLLAQGHPPTEA